MGNNFEVTEGGRGEREKDPKNQFTWFILKEKGQPPIEENTTVVDNKFLAITEARKALKKISSENTGQKFTAVVDEIELEDKPSSDIKKFRTIWRGSSENIEGQEKEEQWKL